MHAVLVVEWPARGILRAHKGLKTGRLREGYKHGNNLEQVQQINRGQRNANAAGEVTEHQGRI